MDAFMSTFIIMSLRGVVIILVVLLVRLLLKKLQISHKYILGLWAMVFLYFILPWKFSLSVGFWNNASILEEMKFISELRLVADERYGETRDTGSNVNQVSIADNTIVAVPAATPKDTAGTVAAIPVESTEQNIAGMNEIKDNSPAKFDIRRVIEFIWLVGLSILFGHMLYSYFALKRKLRLGVLFKDNIWWAENIDIPIVFGLIRPQIYLPVSMESEDISYVIAHEKMHVKRKDGLFKMFSYVVCLIHWFNPFIWIAYFLFGSDMEKACDEEVIRSMSREKRKEYAYALLHIAAGNGSRKKRIFIAPICFNEGNVKSRIRNIMKYKYTLPGIGSAVVAVIVALSVMFMTEAKDSNVEENVKTEEPSEESADKIDEENADTDVVSSEETEQQTEPVKPNVTVDITELYHTHVGDAGNLYFIDENNVLWGSGRNEYGQLGQGTQDYDFHDEAVKIAENVIDVDYSQKGFIIYLTKDNKLYGLGNAGCGALQQYQTFDGSKYVNDEHYCITEPYLLMEDVKYARCGRDDVVCLVQDGTVWIWGTVWCDGSLLMPQEYYEVFYIEKPQKILDDAVLVTGGWNNHAVLLRDGTVWTWGYNISGNCGVETPEMISEPIKVAEDVNMVWTDRALPNYPEPTVEDITMALSGEVTYHTEYEDIAEFDGIYPRLLNNTVIRKTDGSFHACGENVGTEEKIVHGAEADYPVICTYEFVPCE